MSSRSLRFRPLTWVALAVTAVSIVVSVIYFTAGHPKHGVAFLGLAAVGLLGAWFASAPERAEAG